MIPGDNGDAYANLWTFWYLPYALTHGLSPWFSNMQLMPYGVDLIYHTNCYLPMLLTWPVKAFLGIGAAYNTSVLLAISLTGFFFYIFCRENGCSAAGAIIGGFAVAFSPFTFAHLPGHLSMLQMHFVILALLFLARILRAKELQIWNAIGLGTAVWAVAVTDLTLLVTLVCLSLVVLIAAFVELDILWKPVARNIGIGAAASVVLVLPWARALVLALKNHDYSRVFSNTAPEKRFYCSFNDLFVPPIFHGFWGKTFHPNASVSSLLYSEAGGYLGTVCLALVAGAIWLRGSRAVWTWTCAGALFVSFAFGVSFANRVYSLWTLVLPPNFGVGLPLLDQVRVPARFTLPAHACIAFVCAQGFDAVSSLVNQVQRLGVWVGSVALLVLDFFFAPIPVCTSKPSEHYQHASLKGEGSILELPLWLRSGPGPMMRPFAPQQLLDQSVHEKPLLSTYVSRIPKDVARKVLSEPVLRHIYALQRGSPTNAAPDARQVSAFLKNADVRWIVVPPEMRSRTALLAFLQKTVPLGKPQRIENADFYEVAKQP
ncbi:MAG: hypothetical protein ACR2IE_14915 [Candidatus Sumerlaeaceae bacterium]